MLLDRHPGPQLGDDVDDTVVVAYVDNAGVLGICEAVLNRWRRRRYGRTISTISVTWTLEVTVVLRVFILAAGFAAAAAVRAEDPVA